MKIIPSLITVTTAACAILSPVSSGAEEITRQGEKNGGEVTKKDDAKPYGLDICIVSDEKLGEMGKPYVFVHQGQEIKLCCKDCRKKFDKEPAKYLKKLEDKK
jgi:YHS domain-containing protein